MHQSAVGKQARTRAPYQSKRLAQRASKRVNMWTSGRNNRLRDIIIARIEGIVRLAWRPHEYGVESPRLLEMGAPSQDLPGRWLLLRPPCPETEHDISARLQPP